MLNQTPIATFHTHRHGNYSMCLSGQKFSATIFFMKTNKVLRSFSITTEKQYASKEH